MDLHFVEEYQNIKIYRDPYQEKNKLLFGRKGKDNPDPGLIYIPNKTMEDSFKTMRGASIEKDEGEKELKELAKNQDFREYTFCICDKDAKIELIKQWINKTITKQ